MSKHASAHSGSRFLCEALVCELNSIRPELSFHKAKEVCGYSYEPFTRFAYIYHYKSKPQIQIYFRSLLTSQLAKVTNTIEIIDRRHSSGWGQLYPASFYVTEPSTVSSVAAFLMEVAFPLSMARDHLISESGFNSEEVYVEGREVMRLHKLKERNPKVISRKKEKVLAETGGLLCEVCDFDFAKTYGEFGFGFAECHHRIPISQLCEEHRITLGELAIVCSNCHRMLHRQPSHTIDELSRIVQNCKDTLS
ncbi:MAG: HNH endonuclease [Planctomycetaceae bacterium]|nr:HNH endonuclease [Planctomycetaceae bacterium]